MKSLRNALTTACMIAAAGVLAACESMPYAMPGPRAAELPPERGLVVFAAEDINATPVRRVHYADNENRADYVLFQGDGSQAEFVYMEMYYFLRASYVFQDTIRDKVEAWNFSKGQPIEWAEAEPLYTKVGNVYVRPYRLTAMNRACFGVSGEWDRSQEDPDIKHTRLLFGYYCRAPGKDLPMEKILTLVDNIGLKGVTQRSATADRVRNFYGEVEAVKDRGQTERAIEVAQGGGGRGQTGIDGFPFDDYVDYFGYGYDSDSFGD